MLHKLRRTSLHHQGLLKARPFGKGLQATRRAIEHLGYVQIDTLSVVERAHHHTLWSRIPDYHPEHLSALVEDRRVFEYWFHAASYLPMTDYRFVLPQMSAIKRGEVGHFANTEKKYLKQVLTRIRSEGPLRARDFKSASTRNSTWWDWKPAKRALEKLFMQGDLMISGRDGMQKIYDLTERVLPTDVDTREPSLQEFAEYLVRVTLQAHGVTTIKQLTHLRSAAGLRQAIENQLQHQVEQGALITQQVDGSPVMYLSQTSLDACIRRPTGNIRILSPFDNAIIHRDRVQYLFDFNYSLECYVPKEKRQFGYFSLPILYQDNLVGRMDCKAHRRTGLLELINLHLETKNINLDEFVPQLAQAIRRFAQFNGCHDVCVSSCQPKKLTNLLRRSL